MSSCISPSGLEWRRLLSRWLILLCGMANLAHADWAVIDVGSSSTFYGAAGASARTWQMNGQTVSTNPSFVYSPDINAVGTHLLLCEQTFPDGTKSTREWGLRVRIPTPASSLQYFVSPNGADTNAGSIGAPFRTLDKARDTIRALPRPLPVGGVTVYLRGGIHRRTATFTLAPEDSGDSLNAPITYASYPGENAILSNGRALNSTDFTPLNASELARVAPGIDPARIWEVDLATFTQTSTYPAAFNAWRSYENSGYGSYLLDVYFNNTRAWMSRYPNSSDDEKITPNQTLEMNGVVMSTDGVTYLNRQGNYLDSSGASVAVGGAFYYDDAVAARVERWQSALTNGGAWVQGHWNNSWTINALKLQLIDPVNKVIAIDNSITVSKFQTGLGNKYTRDANGNGPGSFNEPWWVINLLEEMDVTGEWCVDFSRNKLYFLASDTNRPADGAVVIADVVTPIASLIGSNVRLQNLTFQESLGNAVSLAGSRNLILGCSFRNISRSGVEINGSMNGVVSCNITELGGAGVMVLGGSASPRSASGNFVVNNDISKFGRIGRVYHGGIHAGYKSTAVGARIAHNRVTNTPHGGIFHGSFDSVFEYNDVSDFCLFSDDMGGFYSFPGVGESSGHVFRYNFVHDSGRNPLNNSPLGNAFYFDLAHEEMTLYGNISNGTVRHSWYKHGNQLVSGIPQLVYNYNNLSIGDGAGFEYVAPKPSVSYPSKIEFNATVGSGTPFRSQEVLVSNGVATALGAWTSSASLLESTPNSHRSYAADIGFVDMAAKDFRLTPVSPIYQDLPGFKPIPFELIGLYNDEFRSGLALRAPFVLNGTATVSGASAVVAGTLAFPQFDPGTTVKLYWGTTDGGSNPAAWQNSVNLGTRPAGPLTVTLNGLSAGVPVYYRFFAENSAGSHWASDTGNTASGEPGPALPAGALLHLDASNATTVTKDGSNKVTRWNDASGGTSYVTQATGSNQPTFITDSALGKTVVDFGAFVSGSTGQWMQLKNSSGTDLNLTTIRSVIAVMKGANFLLGDNDKFHFHRATNDPTSPLWSTQYASANLRNGQAWLNGGATPINSVSDNLPADYWLLSVTTDGNPVEASRLACDRANRTGGQTICELLIFDRVLTTAERSSGETYLRQKWLGYTGGGAINKPRIVIPGNLAVEATGPAGAVVEFTTSAIDVEDGALATTQSPPSGSTFALGGHTVAVTATDSAGNSSRETFSLIVADTTPPQISGPTDLHIEATGLGGAVVNFTPSASDLVSGARPTINLPPSGSTFPWGMTTVTTYASDSAGNQATRTFTVTVADTTPPTLGALPDLTIEAAGPGGAVVNFTPSATDLLDPAPLIITNPVSGSSFPIGITTVTVTATDTAGNASQGNFRVTVRDTTPPVISVPALVTVETTDANGAAVTFSTSASDLVSGTRPTNDTPASGTVFPLGETTVTTTATDAAGNSGSATFVVRVLYPVPAAPVGLTTTPASGEVTLAWQAVPFASTYRIKRSTSAGGPYTTIATISGLSFLDSGRANGLTYYYVVSAVNDTGEGPNSTEAVAVMPNGVYQKSNNATVLSSNGSWTGGVVPAAADTALWTGTYDTANAATSVGAGLSVNSIRITSPSRAMTITPGTGSITLRGTDLPGIDMTTATQSFTIEAPVILAANQTWNINSGRTLTINGTISNSGPSGITFAGAGATVLAANNTYTGLTTLTNGTLHIGASAGSTIGSLAGPVRITGGTLRSNRTDAHAPFGGVFTATAGTLHINSATATLTLNATQLPAGSNSTFTTLSGAAGATLVVDADPSAALTFGSNTGGLNLLLKRGQVRFTTNGGATNLRIEGGSFTATATDRFTLATANQTFVVTGGTVDLRAATQYGFRFGGGGSPNQGGAQKVIATQTGGTVQVHQFNFGGTDTDAVKSPVYNLSGGILTTNGGVILGADTVGVGSTTLALSGGTLRVPGAISGSQAGAKQVFSMSGGTLAVATFTATNLRSADTAANGTFTQNGGTLAPGDVGTAGKTAITGAYNLGASGTLAIDLGGTTQATAYQTGQYDYLTISGTILLAGNLTVKLINGFVPSNSTTFTIVNSTGALTGAFGNIAFGDRVTTAGGEGTFLVTRSGNMVRLTDYMIAPVLNPIESWRQTYFSTTANTGTAADTYDADADGLANLMEYALGGSPASAADAPKPVLANNGSVLQFIFLRARADVTYIVEGSSDLSIWNVIATNPGTVGQTVTVDHSSDGDRRFLRLRVLSNP